MSVQEFYAQLDELSTRASAEKTRGDSRYLPKVAEPLTAAEEAELKRLRTASREMAGIAKDIRRVQSSDKSPQEKRRLIDLYNARRLNTARRAIGKKSISFRE